MDIQIIERFKIFQKQTKKYLDFNLEEIQFDQVDIFNNPNISLVGSKKLDNHEVLSKIYAPIPIMDYLLT